MKDEEMAEEYAKKQNLQNVNPSGIVRCKIADGFLAGLKAGRQQWHYVKDGDLPKDEDYKCCISSNGVYYVARYEELFVSWSNQENKEVCCPYAWCEIPQFKE